MLNWPTFFVVILLMESADGCKRAVVALWEGRKVAAVCALCYGLAMAFICYTYCLSLC